VVFKMNIKEKLAQVEVMKVLIVIGIFLMSITIVWALTLTDHTVYNEETNICSASNLNMNVDVYPCSAQDLDGKNIVQYVNFSWDGVAPQGTSWVILAGMA